MSSCEIWRGIVTQSFPFICTYHTANPRKTFPHKKLCVIYIPTEMFFWDSLCGMYMPMEMFFYDSPCGMYIPTEMIGFRCLARSHTSSLGVLGGPIPDDSWVVWEGPPYRPHSLGDGSKCRRGKGLKTVCIARRCTSVPIWLNCMCYSA